MAIELKQGKFKAEYKSKMELYLAWLDRNERMEGENKPIGLILCTGGGREQIEMLDMEKSGILVSEYWTSLPPKAEFEKKIHALLSEAQERQAQRQLLLGAGNGDC